MAVRRSFLYGIQNHFVDLSQHLRRQAPAKIHHQGRVKGQSGVVIPRIAAEILQIRVLLNPLRPFSLHLLYHIWGESLALQGTLHYSGDIT